MEERKKNNKEFIHIYNQIFNPAIDRIKNRTRLEDVLDVAYYINSLTSHT